MNLENMVENMAQRYVITGAQYEAPVNNKFLDSLEKYCTVNDAELLVLPVKYRKTDEERLHPRLQEHRVITDTYNLNDNIQVKDFSVRPQSIEPTTGLARFAHHDKTTIFASPKQRIRYFPNPNDLPKGLITTGFVTQPDYAEGFVISEKAKKDHKYGAVFVEVEDDKIYHTRVIDSLKNGKFVDLGKIYNGKRAPVNTRPDIVFGDIHAPHDLDPNVHKANLRMIREYRPKNIILHDLFDGKSINHWSQKKIMDLYNEHSQTGLSLDGELRDTAKVLKEYYQAMPKDGTVYVVKSNHDERIERWVNEGRYMKEPQNILAGHKMFLAYTQGQDLLYSGLKEHWDVPKDVKFLDRDSQLRRYGFQIGFHGDETFNGGKGSVKSIENAYGKSVTAHKHTPELLRDTYVVGTSTKYKLDYNGGNSGWLQSHVFLYNNGKAQHVNIVDGRWKG